LNDPAAGWLALTRGDNASWFFMMLAVTTAPILFMTTWTLAGQPGYPWDAAWYRAIAQSGYEFNGDIRIQHNVAFLPGYPLLIRLVSRALSLSVAQSQRLVSIALCMVGALFYTLVFARRLGIRRAAISVLIWTLSPFSIYFLNGYAEAMLFAVSALVFDAIDRGRFAMAGLLISFIMISRPHGIALVPAVAVALLVLHATRPGGAREGIQRAAAAAMRAITLMPLMMLLPIVLTIYWYTRFGDALVYKNAIYAWQVPPIGSGFGMLARDVMRSIGDIFRSQATTQQDLFGLKMIMLKPQVMASIWLLASVFATFVLLWRKEFVFGVFCGSLIAFDLSQSDILNIGRHMVCCFAVPYLLAAYLMPARCANESQEVKAIPRRTLFASSAELVALAVTGLFLVMHFLAYTQQFLARGWVS
jgi:Mannosyltransferase (PIG-V)